MLQLVYTSISTQTLTDRLVEEICARSRDNNRRDEITGVLLAKGDRFLQVLEGPKVVVEDTFMRIVTDPRHHAMTVLSRRMITAREFGDWHMRHCALVRECNDIISTVGAIIEAYSLPFVSEYALFVSA